MIVVLKAPQKWEKMGFYLLSLRGLKIQASDGWVMTLLCEPPCRKGMKHNVTVPEEVPI